MINYDLFTQRLSSRRVGMQLSQSDLARLSGVAVAQISRYESGKSKPRKDIIAKLAQALDVDFEWLSGVDKTTSADNNSSEEIPPSLYKYISITVRLPKETIEELEASAKSSRRSLNSEIIFRLCLSLENDKRSVKYNPDNLSEKDKEKAQEFLEKISDPKNKSFLEFFANSFVMASKQFVNSLPEDELYKLAKKHVSKKPPSDSEK